MLRNTWHPKRNSFTWKEIAFLLGLVSNLALATSWSTCPCIANQHASFLAIKFNSHTIFSSGKFHRLTELLCSTNMIVRNFYLAKAHKTVWDERKPFFVTTPMRSELVVLAILQPHPPLSGGKHPLCTSYLLYTTTQCQETRVSLAREPTANNWASGIT